jgi:hypothetical protein
MRRSMRALLLGCKLLGSVMLAGFFFSSTGEGVLSKECSEECEGDDCVLQDVGKLIAIGVFSVLLASMPLAIMRLAHQRRFVRMPSLEGQEWKLQMRDWQRRDAFIYVAGTLYSLFAINYIVLFCANVSAEDQYELTESSSIGFAQELLFFPMAWTLEIVGVALYRRGRHGVGTAKGDMAVPTPSTSPELSI